MTLASNDSNERHFHVHALLEIHIALILQTEAVPPHSHYLLNSGKGTPVSQTTGAIRLRPVGMIAPNGDIPRPILVLQDNPRLLFDLCRQITRLRVRESHHRGLSNNGRVVAINGIIRKYLAQAQVRAEVAAAAAA